MRIFLNGAMSVILLAAASLSSCTSAASLERQAFRNYKTPLPYSPATGNQATGLPVDTNTDQLIDDGTLQVHRLVVLAETRSPKLLAAYKRWQAAVYGITTATALPDATLSYAEFIDSLETRLGPIERRFALDQKIPNPGKLAAREDAAAAQAQAMRANFEATRLALREGVMLAIADVKELDGKKSVVEKLVEVIKGVEQVVEARLTTGQTTQATLLRVQVERDRLESDLASLLLQRPSLVEALSAVTGVNIPHDVIFKNIEETQNELLPDRSSLLAHLDEHPSLDEDLARVAIARAKASEAGWSWVPDFSLGLEYQQIGMPDVVSLPSNAGRDAFAVKVGISIPWQFHVNDAREEIAEAQAAAAKYAANQTKLNLQAFLERAIFTYDDAARLVRLYDESVLPKARQTLELSQADFATDEASLTDVLDAERALLASELSLIGAKAQLLRGEAKIESLVARDLEEVVRR